MPFASEAQRRLFEAKAHGADYKEGPSQSVAKKFIADAKRARRKRAKKIVDGDKGGS